MGCTTGFKKWFNRRSMGTQIMIGLSVPCLIIFIIALSIYLGTAVVNRDMLISDSEEILTQDVIAKTSAISNEKTNTLVNLINQNKDGYLRIVGSLIRYSTKPGGISSPPVDSYPDNDLGDLKPPLSIIPRSGGSFISLDASSVYFVEQFPNGSNIPSLFTTHEDIINKTSHIDLYCKQYFQNFTDVVAIYFGHEDTGFFRKYPGHSTKLTDPTRAYDPRARPWYTTALTAVTDISITDPYLDAFGLGWMITMSFKITDMSGSLLGVVGIDMLIDTIRTNIVDFQLDNSVSYLIQSNDVVLSAPEWTPSPTIGDLFMVDDITSSPIPNVWTHIKNAGNGSTESGDYIIIFKEVVIGDQTYYYVTSIPKQSALQVVYDHQDSLKQDTQNLMVTDTMIILITFVLSALIAFIFAWYNTRYVRRVAKMAEATGKAMLEKNTDGLRSILDENQSMMNHGSSTNQAARLAHGMTHAVQNLANPQTATFDATLPTMPTEVQRYEAPPTYDATMTGSADAGPLPDKRMISVAGEMPASAPAPTAPPGQYQFSNPGNGHTEL